MGKPIETTIRRELIGVDGRAGFNVLPYFVMNYVAVCRLDWCRAGSTAALAHSENGRLANTAAPGVQFLISVFVGFLAANVSLVDFDDASQLVEFIAAIFPKLPKNETMRFSRVTPISFASCMDEMPLRAVTTRYIT